MYIQDSTQAATNVYTRFYPSCNQCIYKILPKQQPMYINDSTQAATDVYTRDSTQAATNVYTRFYPSCNQCIYKILPKFIYLGIRWYIVLYFSSTMVYDTNA